MRNNIFTAAFSLLALLFVASPAFGQYDDVYYNPSDFSDNDYSYSDDYDASYDEPYEDSYDYDDATYDYEYASRIRR
ncbi:MAG: hypothetical protein AAF840_11070, partial [Bacteroidota bacterium]